MSTPQTILVTGDAVYDHHFYAGERTTADSPRTRGFREIATLGGAKLLHDLIVAVVQCRAGGIAAGGMVGAFRHRV